jgi:hypothetical protein
MWQRQFMRKTTLLLNAIVIVFFICFLAYTLIAREHLETLSRDFVTEKTLAYSRPIVDVASESLDSPLIKKILSDEQTAAIRAEITDYRNDPEAYVSDVTGQQVRDGLEPNQNPLIEKVVAIKKKIRVFYDNTLIALLQDLRIFSISNLIAGALAFGLAYRSSEEIRKPIVWFSFLMFVAVLYCSYMYIDDLSFFRILFRTHMGWWYAALLSVMIVALYLDYGRHVYATEQDHTPKWPVSRARR